MKVLVVDDQRVNRTLPAVLLRQQGCEVLEAECGEDALRLIDSHGFQAILLDVSMPGISGTELCRQLRSRPEFGGVRIIAYTAHAMEVERQRYLAGGFDAVITKPVTIGALKDVVGDAPNE